MHNSQVEECKKQLAESVGEFIKYWGFKEIHGRIWTLVYLSETPVAAKELTERLGVTKGLVSTALAELIAYQVVEKISLGDARSPGYQSNTDLMHVISNILRNRELKLTTKIRENIKALETEMAADESPAMLKRVQKLHEMTDFAVESLKKLLDNKMISASRFKTILRLIS